MTYREQRLETTARVRTVIALVLFLLLIVGSLPAFAGIRIGLAVNADGSFDTNYHAGDKPITPAATCPSGFTCAELGVAVGEIDEGASATDFGISASGPDDLDNVVLGYKSFAAGDIQVCADVPDQTNWTGYSENFTGTGVRIQEGTSTGAWFAQVWIAFVNDTPRFKSGTATSAVTVLGDSLTAAPETLCLVYDDSDAEVTAWQSNDGVTFDPIGAPVARDLAATAVAGVFGTSQEAGQTSFFPLTAVAASGTITIGGTVDPPIFVDGPTAGSPSASTLESLFTTSQDGNVFGVACPNGQVFPTVAQVKAGNCTGDIAAVDAFTQAVVANVVDGDSFAGLTASTTYDTHFAIVSPVTGDSAAIATLADQTTNDQPPVTGSCQGPFASPAGTDVIGSGFYRTTNEACRDANDIVLGVDFALPSDTPIAARSGVFNNSNTFPSYLKGKRLYHCKLFWKDLEPTNDAFDWDGTSANDDSFPDCLARMAEGNFDGILMHVRHTVLQIEDCTDAGAPTETPKHQSELSAPSWVANLNGGVGTTDDEGCHPQDFHITNLNLDQADVKAELLEFIAAFGAQGYVSTANLWHVMHMASASRGEECCGGTSAATMDAIINAWVDAYGPSNAFKLAWLGENPVEQFQTAVVEGGTGNRGGIIETAFRTQYTPGTTSMSGQSLDANGYLTVSSTFTPISQLRHWMDEDEFHSTGEQNYFISMIRAMQMRRNLMWIYDDSARNGRIDDWASTQEGHTATTIPEAWAWLMETRAGGSTPKTINNLERHLLQRETLGATTSSNKQVTVDNTGATKNLTGNLQFPVTHANCAFAEPGGGTGNDCRAIAFTRREANADNAIGFALEDSFWPTSLTHDAVIKITYVNNTAATVTVRKPNDATWGSSFAVTNTGASDIRTATVFVSDFTATASGTNLDFDIHSTAPVDIMFVRVIKNGGSFATW